MSPGPDPRPDPLSAAPAVQQWPDRKTTELEFGRNSKDLKECGDAELLSGCETLIVVWVLKSIRSQHTEF